MSHLTRTIAILTGSLACWLMMPLPLAQAATPPTAYTGQANAITVSAATLTGSVYPSNQPTNYYFEYGSSAAYGGQTPVTAVAASNQTIRVSATIEGLAAGATYHYRLVVANATATVDGGDRVFATKKVPLTIKLDTANHNQVFGTPFSVIGELQGTGNAGHPVVLQSNPFPFLGGFENVGVPVLTDAGGRFAFPMIGLDSNTQMRVSTLDIPPVHSSVFVERLAVLVTLHVKRSNRPGWVKFYGTVAPAPAAAEVRIQLVRRHRSPVSLLSTTTKGGSGASPSHFSALVRIRHAGLYRAHVRVLSGAQFSNTSHLILIR